MHSPEWPGRGSDPGAGRRLALEGRRRVEAEFLEGRLHVLVIDERRGEVLALAHERRVEAGAGFVDDEHMQAALDELGLDPTPTFEGEAPTGAGV